MSVEQQITECKAVIADMEFQLAVEKRFLQRLIDAAPIHTSTSNSMVGSTVGHIKMVLAGGGSMSPLQIGVALEQCNIQGKTKLNRLASSAIRRRTDLFETTERGRYRLLRS